MRRKPADSTGFSRLDIVRAVVVMAAFVVFVGATLEVRREGWRFPPVVATGEAEQPISAEANVFRVRADEVSVAPGFSGDAQAHLRTLEIYRRLRAYPGAPPRIPHGLTRDEYRDGSCNVCHEKGGWVARFGSYAPLTPHPEYRSCLQCHLPYDELVGTPLPVAGRSVVCSQCHVDPDRRPPTFVASDWISASWPGLDVQAMSGSPHLISHEVQTRSNCLACHGGPAAIAGLRTDHPERLNCRQCHVPATDEDGPAPWPFAGSPGQAGGSP